MAVIIKNTCIPPNCEKCWFCIYNKELSEYDYRYRSCVLVAELHPSSFDNEKRNRLCPLVSLDHISDVIEEIDTDKCNSGVMMKDVVLKVIEIFKNL